MKNLIEFKKNMLLLTVCSILGMGYTYFYNGYNLENRAFRVTAAFSLMFGFWYLVSIAIIKYKTNKKSKGYNVEKTTTKENYYKEKEKNKKLKNKNKKRK